MHASLGRWLQLRRDAGLQRVPAAPGTAAFDAAAGFPPVLLWWGAVAVSVGAPLLVLQARSLLRHWPELMTCILHTLNL